MEEMKKAVEAVNSVISLVDKTLETAEKDGRSHSVERLRAAKQGMVQCAQVIIDFYDALRTPDKNE